MISEEMTIDDLLEWANGLGICTFEKQRRFNEDEIACEGTNVHIRMYFGRFDESVPVDGGKRIIHFGAFDNRKGNYIGAHAPLITLDEAERYIERYAEKLDLINPQMTLFSLL
ncbi:MAG: hypothetical protein IJW29_06320 [Clostridia bacterium]|nr:hypothetical protein [Clostridia bacterium]